MIAFSLFAMTLAVAPVAGAYSDVTGDEWFAPYVEALTDAGVFNGSKAQFNPGANMTRAAFVKTLVEAANLDTTDATDAEFDDVTDADWFAPYINTAVENGIIQGSDKSSSFRPSDNVSRAEAVKIALNALGIDYEDYKDPKADFTDDNGHWAEDMISAAYNLSIVDGVKGSKTTFAPNAPITRSAVAKIASYALVVAESPADYRRFEDGESAFSVFSNSEVVTLVNDVMASNTTDDSDDEDDSSDDDDLVEDDEDDSSDDTTDNEEDEDDDTDEVIVSDGALEVTLSSESPSARNIPYNVLAYKYGAYDFTARGDDVELKSVNISRSGLGDKDDFDKIWFEQDGKRLTSKRSINSSDIAILNFYNDVEVEAGKTLTLDLMVSMDAVDSSGKVQSGHSNLLQIRSAEDITANTAEIVGDFPVETSQMGIADYKVTQLVVTTLGSGTTVTVGDENAEISAFKIKNASDKNKDVILKSIRLKNTGTATTEEVLDNLKFERSGEEIATDFEINGDYINISFTEGYIIEDGKTENFYLRSDILAADDAETLQFKLDDKEDLVAYEADTGFAADPKDAVDGNDAEDTNATFSSYSINAGDVTISRASDQPSNDTVNVDTDELVALLAKIKADQEFTVDGLTVGVTTVIADDDGGDVTITDLMENFKLYINDKFIDSTDDVNSDGDVAFDISTNFDQGYNYIKVTYDVKDVDLSLDATPDVDDTFKLTLDSSLFDSPEYVSTGETVSSISGSVDGPIYTLGETSISLSRNDGYSSTAEEVVKGIEDYKVGQFVLSSTQGAVRVTKLKLSQKTDVITGNGDTNVSSSEITGMTVKVDGVELDQIEDLNGNAEFDGLSITVPDGGQKVIEVYTNISTAASDYLQYKLEVTAEDSTGDILTSNNTVNSGVFQILDGGSLTVRVDGNTPNETIVVADTSDVEVAKYKFESQDDALTIKDFYFLLQDSTGTTWDGAANRVSAMKLYIGSEEIDSRVPTDGEVHFDLSSNDFVEVEKDGSVVVTLKADFNTITKADHTGNSFKTLMTDLEVESNSNGIALTVVNETVDINVGDHYAGADLDDESLYSDLMHLRKTQPTLTAQSVSGKLSNGEQTLYKVAVSADSKEDVTVASMTFNVSGAGFTTGVDHVSAYKLYVDGTDKTADLVGDACTGNADSSAGTSVSEDITCTFETYTKDTIVSAGTSKVFELKATVASAKTDAYVSVKVEEDASELTGNRAAVIAENFAWSDNAGAPHSDTTADWFNGYQVNGLDTETITLEY